MDRPPDLFDRDQEWSDLARFVSAPGPGARLALVRGRRRQGKSYLLRRLCQANGGFYYQALEEEPHQALAGIGRAVGQALGVPGSQVRFDSWSDVLPVLADRSVPGRPLTVVIDEFPYLLRHSPELSSVIQSFVDQSRDSQTALRLVLCGSALSVMDRLLSGTKALRGRASVDVRVQAFDYRTAAAFWGLDDPETAFVVHAVVGGTPGYRDLLDRPPIDVADLESWLHEGVLNPSNALFREDEYLLTEERGLSDRALYHSVLTAIAGGRSTQTQVASFLAREQRAVQHPLRVLEDTGFITRTDDALRSRRPIYRIADPMIRFHHVVTRPDLARFEDRQTAVAWEDARARFQARVLAPHFEDLCRAYGFSQWRPPTGAVARVSSAVLNDPGGHTQHEIDLVVLGRDAAGQEVVLALGEAKHTRAQVTEAEVTRLELIRTLVARQRPEAASAQLLLFSASGFDRNLRQFAEQRPDLELFGLADLYVR